MAVRTRRKYSDEFKSEAIRLAESMGRARAARQLGISEGTLSNWDKSKKLEKKLSAKEQAEADRRELISLRKVLSDELFSTESPELKSHLAS